MHQAHHDLLGDYNPEAWGDVLAGAVRFLAPDYVVATGTDVGNEVLAHAAAVARPCRWRPTASSVEATDPLRVRRVRWGGSLIETAEVDAGVALLTVALHAVAAAPAADRHAATPPAVRRRARPGGRPQRRRRSRRA